MQVNHKVIEKCRICNNNNLVDIVDLGNHVISSRFLKSVTENVPSSPLVLTKCCGENVCNLVQLKHTVDSNEMYEQNYGYRSGINTTMTKHLQKIVSDLETLYMIPNTDYTILDIGSNDATLLKSYASQNHTLIGIDPTGSQFKQYYTSNITLIPDYFSEDVYTSKHFEKAHIITSIAMFYDLPDPLDFMKNIKNILAPAGVWFIEQSYLPSMIEALSFDTVCHEHLEYYTFEQIKWMADKVGLKILDVSLNDCNGGSFRVTLTHSDNMLYNQNFDNIEQIVHKEKSLDLNNLEIYREFMKKCDKIKKDLMNFLNYQKQTGKTICIYGASTKGNTLLQYFGINHTLIDCIAERNTNKYGQFTPGTLIPIVSEAIVRDLKPHFMLVLPWHFKTEFLIREQEYLNQGGQFIFPLPQIDVISNYKKILITGITGQIGTYLTNILSQKQKCIIYGTVHNKQPTLSDKIFYINCDLVVKNSIEEIIVLLMKSGEHEIYNLAGITDAQLSIIDPIKTTELNALVPMRICETILHNNKKIKLFQASSSEMFKGLDKKTVSEEDLEMYPKNPYGIAKMFSYWTIKYYRETHNLFACSGILFNTESPLRRESYLTRKISLKIAEIKKGSKTPLQIGSINTMRDWIHAYDAANAIQIILSQNNPEDCVISSGQLNSIKTLIDIAFKIAGIELKWNENDARDIHTDDIYVVIDNNLQRIYETRSEMIVGNNDKLKKLGWINKYDLKTLMEEMVNLDMHNI
jgi:GDP-mannose 4,6-dehydratase